MTADDVLALLDAIAAAGLRCWVEGGWGVDALARKQTRLHRDLDLIVDVAELDALRALLGTLGYEPRPGEGAQVAFADAAGRRLDLRPLRFDGEGNGVAAAGGAVFLAQSFASGVIAGHAVPCLAPEMHLRLRADREPAPAELHDIGVLRAALPKGPE